MLFNNIIIVQDRYITIEKKIVVRIGYNGFLSPHDYSCEGRDARPEYSCGERNPLYPIRAASFVSIALYLILIYTCLLGTSKNNVKTFDTAGIKYT